MNKKAETHYSGIGFPGALTILFIALKMTGHIAWSWLWVLSPLWISTGVALGIGIIVLLILLAIWLVKK